MICSNHIVDVQVGPVVTQTSEWSEVFCFTHAVALLMAYWLWRVSIHREEKETDARRCLVRQEEVLAMKTVDDSLLQLNLCPEPDEVEDCEKCAVLRDQCPLSTAAERKRFLMAHSNVKTASSRLQYYLKWREKHELVANERKKHVKGLSDDKAMWDHSASVAMVVSEENGGEPLPRLARMYQFGNKSVCDRDGMRMLHVMPGQMNSNLAHPSTYSLSLALYIDQQLERSSMEQITVLVDVRGGQGWPNTMPHHQLPFIQTVTKLLVGLFPERCHKCILYPVPISCLWIWNVVKIWLDPATASKMVLLCGPATIRSPPPCSQMEAYMDEQCVELLEKERQMAFIEEKQ